MTIDLTKYEGHTPATEWVWQKDYMTAASPSPLVFDWLGKKGCDYRTAVLRADGDILAVHSAPDLLLIADAPLILEAYVEKCDEVVKLRAKVKGLEQELVHSEHIYGLAEDDANHYHFVADEQEETLVRLKNELAEQAKLNGKGAEREAGLQMRIGELEAKVNDDIKKRFDTVDKENSQP